MHACMVGGYYDHQPDPCHCNARLILNTRFGLIRAAPIELLRRSPVFGIAGVKEKKEDMDEDLYRRRRSPGQCNYSRTTQVAGRKQKRSAPTRPDPPRARQLANPAAAGVTWMTPDGFISSDCDVRYEY